MFSHFFDYSCDVIHGFVCHFFVIYSFLLGLKGNLLILSTFSLTFLVFFSILSWIGFISSWIIVLVLFYIFIRLFLKGICILAVSTTSSPSSCGSNTSSPPSSKTSSSPSSPKKKKMTAK